MITIGIDCGTQRTKAVLIQDEKLQNIAITRTDFDTNKAAMTVMQLLLDKCHIKQENVNRIYITGIGAQTIQIGDGRVNEIIAAAMGVRHMISECDCILDLGAERNRAIRLDDIGNVQGYGVNDKCASGSGTFIEAMARVLETSISDFGDLALQRTKDINLSAQCVVFIESEVISLIHQNEHAADIAWGILDGVASHITALVRRFGKQKNICVIGGPTLNNGLMQVLKEKLGHEIIVPPYAEYVSAYGAALLATQA